MSSSEVDAAPNCEPTPIAISGSGRRRLAAEISWLYSYAVSSLQSVHRNSRSGDRTTCEGNRRRRPQIEQAVSTSPLTKSVGLVLIWGAFRGQTALKTNIKPAGAEPFETRARPSPAFASRYIATDSAMVAAGKSLSKDPTDTISTT